MKRPLIDVRGDEEWLEERLLLAADEARAPRGFGQRVMSAVYREALAGPPAKPAADAASGSVSRLYRRLGLSFMITAAVLTASLLVPRGAYPTLIGSAAGTALGTGPSAAVQRALTGAADAVQGALGEKLIVGGQQ